MQAPNEILLESPPPVLGPLSPILWMRTPRPGKVKSSSQVNRHCHPGASSTLKVQNGAARDVFAVDLIEILFLPHLSPPHPACFQLRGRGARLVSTSSAPHSDTGKARLVHARLRASASFTIMCCKDGGQDYLRQGLRTPLHLAVPERCSPRHEALG